MMYRKLWMHYFMRDSREIRMINFSKMFALRKYRRVHVKLKISLAFNTKGEIMA